MPWHELKAMHREENTNLEVRPNNKARRKHRRNLLGKLSKDLDYLETLLTEVKLGPTPITDYGNTSKDMSADELVTKEAEDAISFLRERQEFWSQFKPMYSK
jgi:hypothetical protein